jgi:hypothetical protein
MATLAYGMTMLRHLRSHWSSIFLTASLLFCAAILVQPLLAGGRRSPSFEANQSAGPIGSRKISLDAGVGIDKAVPGLEPGAPVVRASAWAR